jgi:hypothetical protein
MFARLCGFISPSENVSRQKYNRSHQKVTFQTACPCVSAVTILLWTKLMQILKENGIDWHERRLFSNLYMAQSVKVRLNRGETRIVKIGRGVRQGCCLTPIQFNLYGECLTKEVVEGLGDFKIGGQIIHTVKYADDLVLMTKEEEVLQDIIDKLIEIGRCYGMEMNVEKTKVMRISRQPFPVKIMIDQKQLENVESFKYFGSILTSDGRCTCEIKCRIAMAKAAFSKKRALFPSTLDLKLRKKLVKCYIWSIAETWTLRAVDLKHLESFEMWCWKRMEKISWTNHVRNEEVILTLKAQRDILHEISTRKANWIGHSLDGSSPLCANYTISIDKVGKSKHNKTLLRYRSQKKDNMFQPFYYKAIIRSDMEN